MLLCVFVFFWCDSIFPFFCVNVSFPVLLFFGFFSLCYLFLCVLVCITLAYCNCDCVLVLVLVFVCVGFVFLRLCL